ncbi:MAG: hypothetical protein V5A68_00500 [Candidatus Thermoplasmatota archaeon]
MIEDIMEKKWIFKAIILLATILFLLTIVDIMLQRNWTQEIIAAYFLILFTTIILIYLKSRAFSLKKSVKNFEKTLKGGLYHFKCPICKGIFALKETDDSNKKIFTMNCPKCGTKGLVNPFKRIYLKDEIPEKKSRGLKFRCRNCGEGITVWAEGSDINKNVSLFSCPFCGKKETLKKISE